MQDRYGALKEVGGERTGFFHPEKIHGTWWMIDPEGHGMFLVGTCRFNYHGWNTKGLPNFAPEIYTAYPTTLSWGRHLVERLHSWNFNYYSGVPEGPKISRSFIQTGGVGASRSFSTRDKVLSALGIPGYMTLADVFHPGWEGKRAVSCRRNCASRRNDRNFLGYFTDNELFWGTGWNPGQSVLDALLYQPAAAPCKKEAVRFLRERYRNDLADFRATWRVKASSWSDLLSMRKFGAMNERLLGDKRAFLFHFARRYFKVVDTTIKKYDPNHLNLGCRVHGWCEPEVVSAMGEFVDVISYNKYDNDAPVYQIEQYFAARANRPTIVSEWGFRAMDSGLPNTGGVGRIVATQDQRGKKYAAFLEGLARTPSCVGAVFFSYHDDPAGGGGGLMGNENSNYGLVDFHDRPYAAFIRHVKRANARVHAWRLQGPQKRRALSIAVPRDFFREPRDRFFVQRTGTVLNQRYARAFLRGTDAGEHCQKQTFEMDFAEPVRFEARVYESEGNAVLRFTLDGKRSRRIDLKARKGRGLTSYAMPAGWHTVFDRAFGITVPRGPHTVVVDNPGSGWVWLNGYTVTRTTR